MQLAKALRASNGSRIAFVGAGGKTTALFRLARQLPPPVLAAATTHLATHQLKLADHHFVVETPDEVTSLVEVTPLVEIASLDLNRSSKSRLPGGVILLTGGRMDERTKGVDGQTLAGVLQLANDLNCPLLIEADGSRLRPLKAPAEHEPAIPGFVDTVVVVAGLGAVGKPLTSEWVHRPERFAALSGLGAGAPITAQALTKVLTNPAGGRKNIPPRARRVVLFNQADSPVQESWGLEMVDALLGAFHAVGIASLERDEVFAMHERVAGVVLAAGGSRRLGQPKQLLDWQGKPLVRRVVMTALDAGLSDVLVVTGAFAERVELALDGLPVKIVHNPEWERGQSSSVKAGVRALPPGAGAALFLLADQPWVSPALIRAVVEAYARGLAPIVAPLIDGQRGNPVLFDRVTFDDFDSLTGDVGARSLFGRYRVTWIPWHDPRPLRDVDTMEDYRRLFQDEIGVSS
ncbi:MAG: selenium cofactor biosynthesis protein YqeC [Anaerolineales bacterium]